MQRTPNRLAAELSLYLRQHAHDPVDWYPWGEEAFAAARARNVPVLLSVGYAACHWCHVMAHESFGDPDVAALINDGFVAVKVDREERPDVDAVYMSAVQVMTGAGGWPLTVFLTPQGEPFYGGTYFPPRDRHGTPSFRRVLSSLQRAWRERSDDVAASAGELRAVLAGLARTPAAPDGARPVAALVRDAVTALVAAEDAAGGFGPAPKFPPHAALRFLLAQPDTDARDLAVRTLDAMAAGGVHDQLGGGFFRYAVDRDWRLPHFEKMLADNAQLVRSYALAAAADAAGERHAAVARGIVAWLERELAVPSLPPDEAAFFSALDADSEGGEGSYYAWTDDEFRAVVREALVGVGASGAAALDPDLGVRIAAEHYGVTPTGTFEGGSVPRLARAATDLAGDYGLDEDAVERAVAVARAALVARRETRPPPAVDDKVVSSTNGLLLVALADCGRLLADERLTRLAVRLATFLRRHLWHDGRLYHLWRHGARRVEGLLEDYAFVGLGLVALYRATFAPWALTWALELADACRQRFWDPAEGGYFSTASDAPALLVRPKNHADGATPSESAAAAELAWWAARYRSDTAAEARALAAVEGAGAGAGAAPRAFASSLLLLQAAARPAREVVLVGGGPPGLRPAEEDGGPAAASLRGDLAELVAAFRRHDDGTAVVLVLDGPDHPLAGLPLARGRLHGGRAMAYVCSAGTCQLPVDDPSTLSAQLRGG